MWKYLARIDYRILFIICFLMAISLIVISSMAEGNSFLSGNLKKQIEWFLIGWVVFFICAGFDYRKLKELSWIFYVILIVMLLGLYLAGSIQRVHRWYRLPFIDMSIQPSEYAKLIIVICLAWFLEKKERDISSIYSSLQVFFITAIPFFLIVKQPDLGTGLVLYPIMVFMGYFGGINKYFLRFFVIIGIIGMVVVFLMFNKIITHEEMRPVFTKFMRNYQYERLNPDSYHQKAAKVSIAIGGFWGKGWKQSEYAKRKWLPASHTDSVFAAFVEEFGFVGAMFLLLLFYSLIRLSFQVIELSKDYFGKLLASGIAVYLSMHIIVNIAMMCGLLPISGVPLLLVTYGGSSVITTMAALGILQSIYIRRFMF